MRCLGTVLICVVLFDVQLTFTLGRRSEGMLNRILLYSVNTGACLWCVWDRRGKLILTMFPSVTSIGVVILVSHNLAHLEPYKLLTATPKFVLLPQSLSFFGLIELQAKRAHIYMRHKDPTNHSFSVLERFPRVFERSFSLPEYRHEDVRA